MHGNVLNGARTGGVEYRWHCSRPSGACNGRLPRRSRAVTGTPRRLGLSLALPVSRHRSYGMPRDSVVSGDVGFRAVLASRSAVSPEPGGRSGAGVASTSPRRRLNRAREHASLACAATARSQPGFHSALGDTPRAATSAGRRRAWGPGTEHDLETMGPVTVGCDRPREPAPRGSPGPAGHRATRPCGRHRRRLRGLAVRHRLQRRAQALRRPAVTRPALVRRKTLQRLSHFAGPGTDSRPGTQGRR